MEELLVLGGKHTLAALQTIRSRFLKQGLPVSAWASTVHVQVIKPDCSLHIRARLAGNH